MDPTSRPPVILVVATPARRDRLEQEFANRYARDYDLRVVAGPAEACALVPELAARGSQVALLAVDHDVDGGSLDLMDELRALSPTSRRIVLVGVDTFRAAVADLRPALAQGRLDTYLLVPQGPRDEEFHTAVAEYLSDWGWSGRRPRWSACGSWPTGPTPSVGGIRDFLDRMGLPDAAAHPGQRRGPRHPQRGGRRAGPAGGDGVRPRADRRGRPSSCVTRARSTAPPPTSTRSTSPTCVVVGAGPAGLAAAVYGAVRGPAHGRRSRPRRSAARPAPAR